MAYWDVVLASGYVLRYHLNPVANSINVANNTSRVRRRLELHRWPQGASSDGRWSNSPNTWTINCDGQQLSGTTPNYNFRAYNELALWEDEITVTHGPDGKKNVSGWADWNNADGNLGYGRVDTGWLALPTIPRATTPTLSAASVDAGTPVTITTTRPAGTTFTHTVRYSFGSQTNVLIASGVVASVVWTPPLSLLTQIPTSASGVGTISVETFNGSTSIGTRTTPITITAGADIVPDFVGISNAEANAAVTAISLGAGNYLQNNSRLTLGITGESIAYGSDIVSRTITVSGMSLSPAAGGTATTPNPIGSLPPGITDLIITARVTDRRGRFREKTATVTALAYAPVSIVASNAVRSNSGGTPAEEGTYLRVEFIAVAQSIITSSTQRNALTYTIRTRPVGGAWETKAGPTVSGVSFNSYVTVGTFLVDSSYEVEITAADKFGTTVQVLTVATAAVTMHWLGNKVGIGGYVNPLFSLHVQGPIGQDGLALLNETTGYTRAQVDAAIAAAVAAVAVPGGVVAYTAALTAPTGWFIANGGTFNTASNPQLAAALGTRYNTGGEAAGTARLPSLTSRVVVGVDAGQTEFSPVGFTGGAKAVTYPLGDSGHARMDMSSGQLYARRLAVPAWSPTDRSGVNGFVVDTTGRTVGAGLGGTTQSGPNLQPYIVLTPIIKAG